MAKFEFETGGNVYEIDAPDEKVAAEKFRAIVPPGPTPTHWGRADQLDPAPGYRAGPLGDISKFNALPRTLAGLNEAQAPAPSVSGQPPVAMQAPTVPAAPANSPDTPVKPVTLGSEGFKEAWQQEPLLGRVLAGIGSAPVQAWQSIKQLAGVDVPHHDVLEQRAIASGPAGLIGNIAGNVGMFAVPGGYATRLVAGAPKAVEVMTLADKVRRAVSIPGVAAGEAATLTPVIGDESRVKNAVMGAFLTKALQAGGRALSGLVKPSDFAEELMKLGIQPTISQGGKGVLGLTLAQLENMAASIPGFGRWIKQGQERTANEALQLANARAVPPGFPTGKIQPGRGEFIQEMRDAHQAIRDSILPGKSLHMDEAFRDRALLSTEDMLKDLPRNFRNAFTADIRDILPKAPGRVGLERLQTMEDVLGERVAKFAKGDSVEAKAMRQAYEIVQAQVETAKRSQLSTKEADALTNLSRQEAHGKILEKAVASKKEGVANTSAENLIAAVEASTPQSTKNIRAGLLQDITDPLKPIVEGDKSRDALVRRAAYLAAGGALGVAGTVVSPATLAAAVPAYLLARAGSSRTGAKLAMGNTELQRKMAELLRRRGVQGTMATIGGTEGQREE